MLLLVGVSSRRPTRPMHVVSGKCAAARLLGSCRLVTGTQKGCEPLDAKLGPLATQKGGGDGVKPGIRREADLRRLTNGCRYAASKPTCAYLLFELFQILDQPPFPRSSFLLLLNEVPIKEYQHPMCAQRRYPHKFCALHPKRCFSRIVRPSISELTCGNHLRPL